MEAAEYEAAVISATIALEMKTHRWQRLPSGYSPLHTSH